MLLLLVVLSFEYLLEWIFGKTQSKVLFIELMSSLECSFECSLYSVVYDFKPPNFVILRGNAIYQDRIFYSCFEKQDFDRKQY